MLLTRKSCKKTESPILAINQEVSTNMDYRLTLTTSSKYMSNSHPSNMRFRSFLDQIRKSGSILEKISKHILGCYVCSEVTNSFLHKMANTLKEMCVTCHIFRLQTKMESPMTQEVRTLCLVGSKSPNNQISMCYWQFIDLEPHDAFL